MSGPGPELGGSSGGKVVRVRVFVDGWVRNLPDGGVEAVYEGTRDAVEELLAWTRRGPRWAQVTNLAIHDEEPKGERGFSVR